MAITLPVHSPVVYLGVYFRVPLVRLAVEAATPDCDEVFLTISASMPVTALDKAVVFFALRMRPRLLMVACHKSSTAVSSSPPTTGQVVDPDVNDANVVAV